MANSWHVFIERDLTYADIRDATEMTLIELMPHVPRATLALEMRWEIRGAAMSDADAMSLVGPNTGDRATFILRLAAGYRVYVDCEPKVVRFSHPHGDVENVLAIAGSIGVARFAGGRPDYGYSVLADVPDDRTFDGHDPEDLLARIRLRTPVYSLEDAAHAVMLSTVLGEPRAP